jgi:hypothetical protein
MDVPQAYDYLAAKGQAIKVGDKEDSYNTGCGSSSTRNPTSRPSSRSSSAPGWPISDRQK